MRKFSVLAMLLIVASTAWSQIRNVTGRVLDATGAPVPFATVTVKGTRSAIVASENGNFTIRAKTGDVLTVSGVGIESADVRVTSDAVIVATVNRVTSNLSEVVVTALGVQRQAKELGYSSATVSGKDLTQAKPIAIQNGLTGKVAGLQVNTVNNGVFAPTRITLRGNRSLTGNNQPLIVVDGSIFYNDLNSLNPDDISDINVLKGSSASAVYGSDASNGVLIITTKHGTRGKPIINYTGTVQLENISYMQDMQTRFGSNGGELFVNDFNDLSTYIPYENQSYGPEYNGKLVPLGRPTADGSLLKVPYSYLNNEKRHFFDLGLTAQNGVSYSAGDDNSRFYMSFQDVSSKAVMPGDNGRRDAFRVAGSKTYGIFSADYSVSYTFLKKDVTNTTAVYDNVMNSAGHIPLTSLRDIVNNKFADINGFFNDYQENPWWDIANIRNRTTDNNLTANAHLQLKPWKFLTLSYRAGVTSLSRTGESTTGGRTYSTYAKTSKTVIYSNAAGTGLDTVQESAKNIAQNNTAPSYSTYSSNNTLFTSDFIATFDKEINRDFSLRVSAGTSYMDAKQVQNYINAGTLFFPVFNVNSLTGIPTLGTNNYQLQARKLGYLGEATVGFRNMVFLHGSYRGDIDSRLSTDNRFIPYYDIDLSLVLTDMIPSLKSAHGLSFAKLRTAYSVTGNASPLGGGSPYISAGAYVINPTLALAGGFPYNGLGGFLLNTTIANPNIKPETVVENELGLELAFLQNRISLNTVIYQQRSYDGIVTASIPSSSGFRNALVNAASTRNRGLEMDLKATVVRSRNVRWDVGVNWTHTESLVKSINGGLTQLALPGANGNAYAVVGQSFPVIETRDWNRDSLGRVIVDPVTGNPSTNSTLKILGNATPTDILGFTTSVTWKNFTFSATADYRGGYKIFNSIGQTSDFDGISYTSAITGRQRFVFPNSVYLSGGKYVQNTNVTVDDANFNFWPGLYRNTGANYVVSAAAWKLREVVISYELPRSILAPTRVIQRATFSLSGRNLLMFRPKTNVWTDPEYSEDTGNGVGRTSDSQAPPTRFYTATLSVNF